MRATALVLLMACNEYGFSKEGVTDEGEIPDSGYDDNPGGGDGDDPGPETQVDRWDLDEEPGTDLMFFGDTSGSMSEELTTMGATITTLVSGLSSADGWQLLAVTGPDGCGVSGVITEDTPDYAATFAAALLTAPGTDKVDEWGLYNTAVAAELTDAGECNEGFLRDDALLHVIYISDEDDNSPGYDSGDPAYWLEYVGAIQAKRGNAEMVRFSAIIGPVPDGCATAEPGIGYADAVDATGGVQLSICEDWASSIDLLAGVSATYSVFTLTETPVPETLAVEVNAVARTSGWSYDSSLNAVVFNSEYPTGGDVVVITYEVAD